MGPLKLVWSPQLQVLNIALNQISLSFTIISTVHYHARDNLHAHTVHIWLKYLRHISAIHWTSSTILWLLVQENSAKLTNQRVSYAFTSNPLSFHARHILPTSKLQHRYSCILLILYTTDISEQHVWELSVNTVHSPLVWRFLSFSSVTPMNTPITLISPVAYSRWATFLLPLTVYA